MHYVEGCTAPTYSSDSLHSAVVELFAKPGARIRYTTVQNWSNNVFNLVTKRARADTDATVEWVDCNLGSKLTMKYPSVYLMGERAHGEILSIAFAGKGQHQDAGGKIIHAAPNTTSNIFAKSISKDGGRSSYRGLLEVAKGAHGSKSKVVCDALLLDEHSRSDTYPTIRIGEDDVDVGHEASVSKVGEEQLFYLHVARHRRGGGRQADRQRLHRADRQGAPDGVRGRDEPPDRAPDGGLNWLALRRLALAGAADLQGRPGWEFTELKGFDLAAFRDRRGGDLPPPPPTGFDLPAEAGAHDAGRRGVSSTVDGGRVSEGPLIMPLSQAVEQHGDLVDKSSARSSPPTRTSSPRATRPSGRAARSSTSRPA